MGQNLRGHLLPAATKQLAAGASESPSLVFAAPGRPAISTYLDLAGPIPIEVRASSAADRLCLDITQDVHGGRSADVNCITNPSSDRFNDLLVSHLIDLLING